MENNYFKNRKEVEQFFINETFEFSFCTDNSIFFETLSPISLGGQFYRFELCFYLPEENSGTFFKFSSFKEWLDVYKLCHVRKISEQDLESETLFFQRWDETL